MINEKVTLQNLIEIFAKENRLSKEWGDSFVKTFFDLIKEGLEQDRIVKIKGFGTFKIVDIEPRESVNVNTGERFQIAGHSKVSFAPDAILKDVINQPFADFETVILNEGVSFDEKALADSDNIDNIEAEDSTDEESQVVEETPAPATVVPVVPVVSSSLPDRMKALLEEAKELETEITTPSASAIEADDEKELEKYYPSDYSVDNASSMTSEDKQEEEETKEPKDAVEENVEELPAIESLSEKDIEEVVPIEKAETIETVETTETEQSVNNEVSVSEVEEKKTIDETSQTEQPVVAIENRQVVQPLVEQPKKQLSDELTQETPIPEKPKETNVEDIIAKELVATPAKPAFTENVYKRKYKAKKKHSWELNPSIAMGFLTFLILLAFGAVIYWFLAPEPPTQEIKPFYQAPSSAAHDSIPSTADSIADADTVTMAEKALILAQNGATTDDSTRMRTSLLLSEQGKKAKGQKIKKEIVAKKPQPTVAATPVAKKKNVEPVHKSTGKVTITGLKTIHIMAKGENLYTIAKKYLGSKAKVNYLIRYNNFKNPDMVTAGTKIRIPQLSE